MDNDSSTSKILYIAKDGGESHIASTDFVSGGAPTSTAAPSSAADSVSAGGAPTSAADSVSAGGAPTSSVDSVSAGGDTSSDEIIVGGHADSGNAETLSAEGVYPADEIEVVSEDMSGGDVELPKDLMPTYFMDGGKKNSEADSDNDDDESSLCSDDIYAVDPICARLKRFLESKNNEPMIDILTDIRDQLVLLNEKFNNKKEE